MSAYIHALRLRWQDWRLAISAGAGEWKKFAWLVLAFLAFYFLPITSADATRALAGGLALLQEYARKHVLTCLVPAFFIAGGIAVYIKKDSVLRLLGPMAKKYIAYPVAAISGGLLAVCSCTILPLFAGIYKRGAGIGPAVAFLFTGPAINVTAIILTASVIGVDFAIGRLLFAMIIAIVAGIIMTFVFRDHDRKKSGDLYLYRRGAVHRRRTAVGKLNALTR